MTPRTETDPVVVRVILEADGRRTVHYYRDALHARALARRVERAGGRVLEVAEAHPDEWPRLSAAADVPAAGWVTIGAAS